LQIVDNVFLIGGFNYRLSLGCNAYMIRDGDDLTLIDLGFREDVDTIFDNIREAGSDPRRISSVVATHYHCDHVDGLAELVRRTECRVIIGREDADAVEAGSAEKIAAHMRSIGLFGLPYKDPEPVEVSRRLVDNEIMNIGDVALKAVHVPGHTPGSMCLVTEIRGKKVLFSGDVVQGGGLIGWIGGIEANLGAYKESLYKLLPLKPEILLPGHGTLTLRNGLADIHAALHNFPALHNMARYLSAATARMDFEYGRETDPTIHSLPRV
jgi:glyoxylase-like metal-dependent hydrolase (beta-lactamase superfamily II)